MVTSTYAVIEYFEFLLFSWNPYFSLQHWHHIDLSPKYVWLQNQLNILLSWPQDSQAVSYEQIERRKKKKLNQNITKIREKSSWAENRYPNSSLPAVALLVTVNPTGSVMCVHKQQTSKLLQEQLSWCLVKGLCSNHEHHYVWK